MLFRSQGLTEFLPVSSSGHLLIVQDFMFGSAGADYLLFDILLHVATLFAVVLAFRKEIIGLFKPPFKTLGLLALATVPAGITGLLVSILVDDMRVFMPVLWVFFLVTAGLMVAAEWFGKKQTVRQKTQIEAHGENPSGAEGATSSAASEDGISLKTALGMGFMQALAPLPGISRSGSTLFGGIVTGGKRESLARFSFFMSIPIILASLFLELLDLRKPEALASAAEIPWFGYVVAMLVAFAAGYAVIKFMLRIIAKANFKWFAVYLVGLAVFSFIRYGIGV